MTKIANDSDFARHVSHCWAQIDLDALENNYFEVRRRLDPDIKILAVLKANAYGHGDRQIGKFVEALGADYLGVACLDEAVSLRIAGCKKDILIFGATPSGLAGELVKYGLTQTVSSHVYACDLSKAALDQGLKLHIHIKIETGMNRFGYCADSPEDLSHAALLYSDSAFICTGIYTHFSCADEAGEDSTAFTQGQYEKFDQACRWLKSKGFNLGLRHCSATSASLLHPGWHMDMIRLGLGLYGITPFSADNEVLRLTNVMSVYTWVSMVKEIPVGSFVSYGREFQAKKPTKVATVSIGYADGYIRIFSSRSRMLIHGEAAPVLGRVCMDFVMLAVTDIPDVKTGDLVTVVGVDGDNQITFDELAALSSTIAYERLCAISQRVPRVYVRDGSVADTRNYLRE